MAMLIFRQLADPTSSTYTYLLGDRESGWAMPCAPFGGSQMGFFALPVVDVLAGGLRSETAFRERAG